jgi:N-acetylglucosamine-6-sulfatase
MSGQVFKLDRRGFLAGTVAVLATSAMGCQPDRRPNVLVICLDDMRADLLQFMPKTRALFDHEFVQSRANGGSCTDVRLGLFTGTYTLHHPWSWIFTWRDHDGTRTWGPWMHAAGYRTGLFGKYITTDGWTAGRVDGWDTWRGYYAQAHRQFGYVIDDGSSVFSPSVGNLRYLTDELIGFTNGRSPWFASWNPQHPHTITETGELEPLPEHADDFPDLNWPVPLDEDVTGKPAWIQALAPLTEEDVLDIQRAARGQARVLAGVDDAIERIFASLQERALLDRTVVILTSDQGVHYGEHRWGSALGVPAAVQKMTLYEPVVRTPLLVRGPGFVAGSTDVPVSQCDITATVTALAGAQPSHALDGTDLRSIAADPGGNAARTELLQAITIFTVGPSYDGVVTGPDHPTVPSLKFARLATGEVELYDLAADPGELVNLADDPARAAQRAELEQTLAVLLGQ